MSIATELDRIIAGKENIKTSVYNKGVEIPENTLINLYSNYIDNIPTGGIDYPVYTCNLKYACFNNLQLINDLNNAQILGCIEEEDQGIINTTFLDTIMNHCFYDTTFDTEDPIALTNKVINASHGNYENAYFDYAFSGSVFSNNYENHQSKITFKNGNDGSYHALYLTGMFNKCNISNFKDVELDFTNLTDISYIYIADLFAGAITGNNSFKITNLPVYHLSSIYVLNSNTSMKVKIKKLTSNGEKLRYRLNLKNLDMTREVFMEFINSLGAVTSGTVTINLDNDVYNLLTVDDLAAVTAKNYVLSV